jgi:hypothetical protein
MAQDSPEVASLKEQVARLNAERDLAKAELERLQAQKSLADAQAGPTAATQAAAQLAADKAAAEAQKAVYDQQKAAADAQTAALNAETAALKARAGSVAGSTLSGSVEVGTGAGNAEASLLAALVVEEAGARIARAVKAQLGAAECVVYSGSQRPTFSRWRAFDEQRAMVQVSFENAATAVKEANAAESKVGVTGPAPGGAQVESLGALLTAGGAALDVASKIGSYFQSDYKVNGVTVSGSDDELLAVAVAGRLPGCFLPGRWSPLVTDMSFGDLLRPLMDLRDGSTSALVSAQAKAEEFKRRADAEKETKKKEQLALVAVAYRRAADLTAGAQKRFDDFVASLGTADKDGTPLAVAILDERAMHEKLKNGAFAIIVRLNTAVGGSYTKKNLWTFFGGMPFFVSGGGVASYVAMNGKTGTVVVAGEFALHSGYHKASDVQQKIAAQQTVLQTLSASTQSPTSNSSPTPTQPPTPASASAQP